MSPHRPVPPPTGGTPRSQPRRRHLYFAMMGTCVALFVLAWSVVRLWSVPLAVAMCVVAMALPPLAAVVANRRGPQDRWWDEDDPRQDGDGDRRTEEHWRLWEEQWRNEDDRGRDER